MDPKLAYWVHDLNPVIFQITETLAVRWYGLAYVTGFLAAIGLLNLYWRQKRSPVSPRIQETLVMALILGVVVGGRLGYFLLYETSTFLRDPLVLLRVWEGGMASHGGFIGVALAAILVARKNKIHPLALWDLIASITPPGLLLGRLANFINGELWGKVTNVSWAVIFPQSAPPGMPVELIAPRHPSQLYQAGLEGFLLLVYIQWRFWSVKGRGTRGEGQGANASLSARPGHLTGEFLFAYGVLRSIGEIFREPDAALLLGLSRGTFYSVFLCLIGAALIYFARRRQLTNGQRG